MAVADRIAEVEALVALRKHPVEQLTDCAF